MDNINPAGRRIKFRFAEILRERGITQRQAALKTGISENGISNLVGSGLRQVRFDTLQSICIGLEIEIDELIKLE